MHTVDTAEALAEHLGSLLSLHDRLSQPRLRKETRRELMAVELVAAQILHAQPYAVAHIGAEAISLAKQGSTFADDSQVDRSKAIAVLIAQTFAARWPAVDQRKG